jgi:serine/threonine protein kinase
VRTLKHPNVLDNIDAFEESKSFCIVTGLCDGGELFDRVAQGHFSENVATQPFLINFKPTC